MEKIIKRPETLPEKAKRLRHFIAIRRREITAYRAKLRAMDDIGMIEERMKVLNEAQNKAEEVLGAEAEMGEILKNIEKEPGKRTDLQPSYLRGTKLQKLATKKLSYEVQKINKNWPIVEDYMGEAREKEQIATHTGVITTINTRLRPEIPPMIKGKFDVIYADPPWQYQNVGFDESAEQQYPTMPVEEICAMPIQNLITDKTVLFLWVTNAFINEGLRVCEAWGFEYKTNFAWIKNKGPSIGWFTKSRHELLLIATRGEGVHPKKKLISWFKAEATKHSKKPEKVYEMIESMYTGPYIELFARQSREGWNSWGNELE